MRGYDIHGRTDVTVKGAKYRHQFEHRGSGIVAIYSYGRSGDHDAIVREAKRIMKASFGVSGATTSGGISDWPKDGYEGSADYNDRTVETQTIFSIDAHGGPNRKRPKQTPPSGADWHVEYTVDIGPDYLGDGEVNLYFTAPLLDEEEWREVVDRLVCEGALEEARTADRAKVLELKVHALSQGRYWFLSGGDPAVEIDWFEVTP